MVSSERVGLNRELNHFLTSGFSPRYDQRKLDFTSRAIWRRFRELGTQLWLDTGSITDAEAVWTQEFSALTTNNTLLNKEIQTGRYDVLIAEIADILDLHPKLSDTERIL